MLVGTVAFVGAVLFGTFVEYWGHRFMHRWLLRKRHARHHQQGQGQGWLGEFFDYSTGTLALIWVGFLHSFEAGVGFVAGALAYAAWAAYSHQLQHEHPELCFWLRRPVHYLHHHHHLWHHNFGISVSLWDHVFRTYKKVDWRPAHARPFSPLAYLRINWLGFGSFTGKASGGRQATQLPPAPPTLLSPAGRAVEVPCRGSSSQG